MKRILYDKIVRDKIPQIIQSTGNIPTSIEICGDDVVWYLEQKLIEELNEYMESHEMEELADLLEVIHSIALYRGFTWEQLEVIRLQKREAHGGFEHGVILKEVAEP